LFWVVCLCSWICRWCLLEEFWWNEVVLKSVKCGSMVRMFFCFGWCMFLVSRFWLGLLIKGLEKKNESKLHRYVAYFKLAVLKFGISCIILMLIVIFFLIQTCSVMVVWLAIIKKTCFRGKKIPVWEDWQ
jgi:hypothetical protein